MKPDPNVEKLSAHFGNDAISLLLPEKLLGDWASTDHIGFQNTLQLENGDELLLLLEKDFTCLDNTLEDRSEHYPNSKVG